MSHKWQTIDNSLIVTNYLYICLPVLLPKVEKIFSFWKLFANFWTKLSNLLKGLDVFPEICWILCRKFPTGPSSAILSAFIDSILPWLSTSTTSELLCWVFLWTFLLSLVANLLLQCSHSNGFLECFSLK